MKNTQTEQVINAMRNLGGFATFGKLQQTLDVSLWKTKTPEATIRRIVQESPEFFRIQPGLWALTGYKDAVLKTLHLKESDEKQKREFSHSYYQGLVVEIGNLKGLTTYIPSQDKNKLFLNKPLKDFVSCEVIYDFTYPEILAKAKTIDVIWFNSRRLPNAFFEVEHSTNIEHSLVKFFNLQDYFAKFYIIADESRHAQFSDIIGQQIFEPIKGRVGFVDYETISSQHTQMCKFSELSGI